MIQDIRQLLITTITEKEENHYWLAFSYIKNKDDALDIIQESIKKALISVDKINGFRRAQKVDKNLEKLKDRYMDIPIPEELNDVINRALQTSVIKKKVAYKWSSRYSRCCYFVNGNGQFESFSCQCDVRYSDYR